MQIQTDTATVLEMLLTTLSRQVLLFVALNPGTTAIQVFSAVLHWLPSGVPPQLVREISQSTLATLLSLGEIQKVAKGRMTAIPPLAIECEATADACAFRLLGNPLPDGRLDSALREVGARLVYEEQPPDEGTKTHACQRRVEYRSHLREGVTAALSNHGYRTLSQSELGAGLSGVDTLTVPPVDAFRALETPAGYLDAYEPAAPDGRRWQAVCQASATDSKLVRWHDGERAADSEVRRYFLHGGHGLLFEVCRDHAALWQLRLNYEAGACGSVLRGAGAIRVQLPLPQVYVHWLQARSPHPIQLDGGCLIARMTDQAQAETAYVLSDLLHLRTDARLKGEA